MKNELNVNVKVSEEVNKMADKIQEHKYFRYFAWGALICITVLMPLAIGFAVWLAK